MARRKELREYSFSKLWFFDFKKWLVSAKITINLKNERIIIILIQKIDLFQNNC
ncbi:PH domain-containing protein [Chryseobacterium sp. FH1]|uniref:PH domain-containing protein n=1 Tax=Chryseobacterium sp. FH1 TaxID=1233951 RepID=UPI0009DDE54C